MVSLTSDEIASQPDLWRAVQGRADEARSVLGAAGERVLFIGCGTSAFVAQSLAWLRASAGLGVSEWAYASEVPPGHPYDRVVALTRSGTTSEVLAALRETPPGARRVTVTGVAGMPVEDVVDDVLLLAEADERSVVQTRFPTTLLVLGRAAFGENVAHLPDECAAILRAPLPVDVTEVDHYVYLGRGWAQGLAHEAALKIREAAQAWAESYPAMDYRHGPIAVAGPRSAVWGLGGLPDGLAADVAKVGARVVVPDADPLAALVLAQRVAVALAESRGLDPDHPRALTRSVVL